MKPIQVELPDDVAKELDALVRAGWFRSEVEVVRLALVEYVRRYSFALSQGFQKEDIEWALKQTGTKPVPKAGQDDWQPLIEGIKQFTDDFMAERE